MNVTDELADLCTIVHNVTGIPGMSLTLAVARARKYHCTLPDCGEADVFVDRLNRLWGKQIADDRKWL